MKVSHEFLVPLTQAKVFSLAVYTLRIIKYFLHALNNLYGQCEEFLMLHVSK